MKNNRQIETTTSNEPDGAQSNVLNFSTTLRQLRKTVDPHLVRQRAGRRDHNGNIQMVEYIEWHTVADILDETAPNWAHSIKSISPIGDIITVTVAISIDGVTREGVGTGKAISETGIKKAEHDALKRAAVKFGIARELYKREFESIDQDDKSPVAMADTHGAVAQSIGDMITGKQLAMIRAIGREAGLDAESECTTMMSCRIDELSKRAASDLIERLQSMKQNAAVAIRRVG